VLSCAFDGDGDGDGEGNEHGAESMARRDGEADTAGAPDPETVTMLDVYARLRAEILDGTFAPAEAFSQVKLAERLGVSRTPLREALRLLEREGLIETTPNRRARVVEISVADLDDLYGTRILVESLAITLSAPLAGPTDLAELERLLAEMDRHAESRDTMAWEVPHARFHRLLIRHAGTRLLATAGDLRDHSQRYRTRVLAEPLAWETGSTEHRDIYHAYAARDAARAADRLAVHYARTALTLIARMAPEYDPAAIRGALRFVQAASR
jgi:DNA-binding GntR family transcriptional regulator